MSLRVGALFAGYGGLERAVSMVFPTARPVWFSQYDPEGGERQAPSRILAHHWPDVPNHGDITRIDWSQVEPIDILTGGFPCQDVSHAGKRAGLGATTRTGLWGRMADAIDTLRPRLVVAENVRGLLSAQADSDVEPCPWCMGGAADGEPPLRALGAVLGDLAELGFDAAWVGLRAADVGAPHGRFRVFILAWPQSDTGALTWPQSDTGALLPTPAVNDMGAAYMPDEWDEWTARMRAEHGNGNGHGNSLSVEALRLLPTPTVSDTNGAGEHGTGGADLRTAVSLLPTPRATDGTKGGPHQRGSSGDLMLPSAVLLPTPTAMDSKASGGNPDTTGTHGTTLTDATVRQSVDFGQYAPAIARWEAITRPAPSPTEPTGKGGAQRLSPRFVEWMQGLPDGWVTDVPGITRNDTLKALGNGVVPQQAAEAIRWLLDVRATAMAA